MTIIKLSKNFCLSLTLSLRSGFKEKPTEHRVSQALYWSVCPLARVLSLPQRASAQAGICLSISWVTKASKTMIVDFGSFGLASGWLISLMSWQFLSGIYSIVGHTVR